MDNINIIVHFVEKNSLLISVIALVLSVVPAVFAFSRSVHSARSMSILKSRIDKLEEFYDLDSSVIKRAEFHNIVKFLDSYDKIDNKLNILFPEKVNSQYRVFVEAFSKLSPSEKANILNIIKDESYPIQERILRNLFEDGKESGLRKSHH